MNTLRTGLIAVILSTSLLYGADTINEQIQAIQKASVQERAELMNKLKIQIASMNEEERADAISSLRTSMGGEAINTRGFQAPMSSSQRIQQSAQQNTLIQRSSTQINSQIPRMGR
ncbi:MAG: hypothetical protein Q8N01_04605 [Sulfuricurvum sp.]|jgi:hypothetical protein|nr:hypothetical protein [Sulfuricurvum sp.]